MHNKKTLFLTGGLTYSTKFKSIMTTKIFVPEHIAEYLNGKFGKIQHPTDRIVIHLPIRSDTLILFADVLQKRPPTASPIDKGNIEIYIPHIKLIDSIKNPLYYNYINKRNRDRLVTRFDLLFKMDLFTYIEEQKYNNGITYQEATRLFLDKLNIYSFNEETGVRTYRRWRENGGYVKLRNHSNKAPAPANGGKISEQVINKIDNNSRQTSIWTTSPECEL